MITQPDTLTPLRFKRYAKWNDQYEKATIQEKRAEASQAMERLRRLLNMSHGEILQKASEQ